MAIGENVLSPTDFARLIETRAVDYIQPSVSKIGGISVMRDIYALANQASVSVAPHSAYFGPGLIATAHLAAALSRALKLTVRHTAVTPAQFRGFGFPGADDLGNMFQFYRDFEREFRASRDVSVARSLNPSLQSFDQWLAHNASRIPLD